MGWRLGACASTTKWWVCPPLLMWHGYQILRFRSSWVIGGLKLQNMQGECVGMMRPSWEAATGVLHETCWLLPLLFAFLLHKCKSLTPNLDKLKHVRLSIPWS